MKRLFLAGAILSGMIISPGARATEALERLTPATLTGTWEAVDGLYGSVIRMDVRESRSKPRAVLIIAPTAPEVRTFVFTIETIDVKAGGVVHFKGIDRRERIAIEGSGDGSASGAMGIMEIRFKFLPVGDGLIAGWMLWKADQTFVKSDGTTMQKLAAAAIVAERASAEAQKKNVRGSGGKSP